MAGGGGGAVAMRLNIMTALYLPILGYAMSTFDVNPDALVVKSDNLQAYAISQQNTVPVGDTFQASIMYELRPTDEQQDAISDIKGEGSAKKEKSGVKMFEPEVIIDEGSSPEGMYYDTVEKRIIFNTNNIDFAPGENQKRLNYKATVNALTLGGEGFIKEVENTFTVFRPVVRVQSNAAPRLLSNCRNSLTFSVTGVEANDIVLSDRASGRTENGNSITWAPPGDTTVFSVSYKKPDGTLTNLDNLGFRISQPPAPIVGLRMNDNRDFMTIQDQGDWYAELFLVVQPDDDFAKDYPDDANYEVGELFVRTTQIGLAPQEATVNAQKMRRMIANDRKIQNSEIVYMLDFYEIYGNLPTGTSLFIGVNELNRVNYEGKRIPVNRDRYKSTMSIRM
jgi:hypothetical protein